MAAMLNLMPPGVPIVTVVGRGVIRDGLSRPVDEPACYLAHEIGSGDWYGYIWGRDVADFLSLIDGQRRIASCLHADTLDELTGIRWNVKSDTYEPVGDLRDPAGLGRYRDFLQGLVEESQIMAGAVRYKAAAFYRGRE